MVKLRLLSAPRCTEVPDCFSIRLPPRSGRFIYTSYGVNRLRRPPHSVNSPNLTGVILPPNRNAADLKEFLAKIESDPAVRTEFFRGSARGQSLSYKK